LPEACDYQETTRTQSSRLLSWHNLHDDDDQLERAPHATRHLVLLHHWTIATSLTVVNDPSVDHFWQSVIVQIAFRYPYVMYGIFGLAALHLASLHSSERSDYVLMAAHYHNKALGRFQAEINDITRENSDALFASAILNMIYTFAIFGELRMKEDESPSEERSRILGKDWIPLIRGVMSLLGVIREHISDGPLRSMLSLGNWERLEPDTAGAPNDVEFISLHSSWTDSPDASVYDETLHILRKCRVWMTQFRHLPSHVPTDLALDPDWTYNRSWSGPFIWLSLAPECFFQRLQQRQPQALLLFAHFGVLIHDVRRYWWMQSWGKQIIRAVNEILGDYWNNYMEFPNRYIDLSDPFS
jgi:hypothetical protein